MQSICATKQLLSKLTRCVPWVCIFEAMFSQRYKCANQISDGGYGFCQGDNVVSIERIPIVRKLWDIQRICVLGFNLELLGTSHSVEISAKVFLHHMFTTTMAWMMDHIKPHSFQLHIDVQVSLQFGQKFVGGNILHFFAIGFSRVL